VNCNCSGKPTLLAPQVASEAAVGTSVTLLTRRVTMATEQPSAAPTVNSVPAGIPVLVADYV
jgi:hypothetical protein